MSLRVVAPGLYTLVVDFGRPHCRSLGVPVGGAADRTSLMLGNALVGNAPDAAALEFSLLGPTLLAECDLACVVCGAPFQLHSDRQKLTTGKTFTLHAGEVLHVAATPEQMRAYLCVRGGLQTKRILDSRSGLAPLRTGDELPCLQATTCARFFRTRFAWERERQRLQGSTTWLTPLRALPGPQEDWCPLDGQFFEVQCDRGPVPPLFQVAPASNRMGLRLLGRPQPISGSELVSEPVCPGAVQVTRDGQCIILGVDGQTIGGYPKIAQIISADLDVVGQLRPGEEVFFVRVSLEEAERLYREKQAELRAWGTRLRAAAEGPSR